MKHLKKLVTLLLAVSMAATFVVAGTACNATSTTSGSTSEETSDLGPYTQTDSNGTVWKLVIEDNYDFILTGTKTDTNGDVITKKIVGPTFDSDFGENGSVTLGVAALTLYVNDVEDTVRETIINYGYKDFQTNYNRINDTAMAHIPVGINNKTMKITSSDVELETIAPGWGEYTDLGTYYMTDEDGTRWSLVIESNYDFILEGQTTDESGNILVKRIVGPTFDSSFGADGSIKLGVAALTFFVNGVEDADREAVAQAAYSAAVEAYNKEYGTAMAHLPIGINNKTMTMYEVDEDGYIAFASIAPGWGLAETEVEA